MCRNNDRDKKQREETKIQLKTNPIMCGKFEMKQAEKEKWLGQQISAGGLAESVAETVAAKEGKIKAACIEVANIVNDWRTEIVGGLDANGASEVIESHVIQVMQVIQMRHGMKAMLEMQGSQVMQVIQVSLAHLAKCGALHLI